METNRYQFSKREMDVISLLMQGKSNKQIAHELGISSRTVEFHLGSIFTKLNVTSRVEAILKLPKIDLRESAGQVGNTIQGESPVESTRKTTYNENEPLSTRMVPMKKPVELKPSNKFWITAIIVLVISILVILIAPRLSLNAKVSVTPKAGASENQGIYERECEYPEESTVGQLIQRSNATGLNVHGQFGTIVSSPWSPKAGYVKYTNISLSSTNHLYLKLRYSKNSPESTPILIYIDNEQMPRATFYPLNQGDWDQFVLTAPIPLGSVEGGIHSIKFYTTGQQYGVADLDMFILTTETSPAVSATQITLPANNDLLVRYDFEDNFLTSGYVIDRSGNGYDAQINGVVNTNKGIAGGQAIFFSGDGYILAKGNPAAGRNNISFSLWFMTDHPEENYKLASAAWWNGGPGSGWIMATHIPEFWSDDTKGLCIPDITNNDNHFPAGEWIHEVVTYEGNRIKEYTNGQLINDWPATGAAIGQGQAMAVGAWPMFSAYNFQGSIDEFEVFARSLTLQEIQELYNQGK